MDIKEKTTKENAFKALGKNIRESIKTEGVGMGNFKLWINLGAVAVGFLFGGCHLFFGAHPLGLSLVSALPVSVWFALLGVALGSLTLGKSGIIYAMICVLSVFLRIIISGSEDGKKEIKTVIFSENVSLRVSAAVISGFVAAVYEILLGGIRLETVLFGVAMVLFSAVFTFAFSGAFYHGIGARDLIFGTKRIFSQTDNGKQNQKLLFLKISLTIFIALIALALNKYNVFGISLSFVFCGCITLFASKRFGAFYGAAVGFASSVLVSGLYSAAYALLGVLSGALFPFGTAYAVFVGGAVISLWGSYISGVSGFLGLFPEYLISLCIIVPMIRYFEREEPAEQKESVHRRATDMVGTMALAYRNRQELFAEKIEKSLGELLPIITSFSSSESTAEDYAVFLKLMNESKERSLKRREMDEELTEKLEDVFSELGFRGGIIRAFGDRRKYIICSGEDKDGTLITSPDLKRGIERASGLTFSSPEYYRRGDMVLMECEVTKKYKLTAAVAMRNGQSGEVSGDTVDFFESKELFAYGIISDGMGSGNTAKKTSEFAVDFIKSAVSSGASYGSIIHMMNSIIRRKAEECSVTVDMFCFDMINGDAEFVKSGAAASYIKRKNTLYRIKSETMPIGLIKQVDAEKIKASVLEGDYIIMLSDGICDTLEDAPWLVELLNRAPEENLEEYAKLIVDTAKINKQTRDDMSALIMRVSLA